MTQTKSTEGVTSAASDVLKRQRIHNAADRSQQTEGSRQKAEDRRQQTEGSIQKAADRRQHTEGKLPLIHISEPTRLGMIPYAVCCLKKNLV